MNRALTLIERAMFAFPEIVCALGGTFAALTLADIACQAWFGVPN